MVLRDLTQDRKGRAALAIRGAFVRVRSEQKGDCPVWICRDEARTRRGPTKETTSHHQQQIIIIIIYYYYYYSYFIIIIIYYYYFHHIIIIIVVVYVIIMMSTHHHIIRSSCRHGQTASNQPSKFTKSANGTCFLRLPSGWMPSSSPNMISRI